MTDEQVVKALECCTKKYGCCDCPLENDELCMITINKEALDLIKRLTYKVDSLEWELDRMTGCLKYLENKAYEKFAERLLESKYESSDWSHGEHPYVVEESDIENLLYELTEGSNESE